MYIHILSLKDKITVHCFLFTFANHFLNGRCEVKEELSKKPLHTLNVFKCVNFLSTTKISGREIKHCKTYLFIYFFLSKCKHKFGLGLVNILWNFYVLFIYYTC